MKPWEHQGPPTASIAHSQSQESTSWLRATRQSQHSAGFVCFQECTHVTFDIVIYQDSSIVWLHACYVFINYFKGSHLYQTMGNHHRCCLQLFAANLRLLVLDRLGDVDETTYHSCNDWSHGQRNLSMTGFLKSINSSANYRSISNPLRPRSFNQWVHRTHWYQAL